MSERVGFVVASPKTDRISAMALVVMAKTTMPRPVKSTLSIMGLQSLCRVPYQRSSKPRGFREMDKKLNRVCNASRRNKDRHPAPTVRVKACPHYSLPVQCPLSANSGLVQCNKRHGYSITSSARLCSDCGTVMPSALVSSTAARRFFSRSCGEA